MNKEKIYAVAKWLGMQLAAKAVNLALGLPIIAAGFSWIIAHLVGLSSLAITLIVICSVASVSIGLNLLWAFSAAFSVEGALTIHGLQVEGARSRVTGQPGYGIILWFKSDAKFPMQYRVDRITAHLERNLAIPELPLSEVYEILPSGQNVFMIGVAQMPFKKSATLHGELDIDYSYGRPGKLKNKKRGKYRLWVETDDASGDVREARLISEH